jgi:hypothetical protein
MKGRELKGSEARGRNGWFVPGAATVNGHDGQTHLRIYSRRRGAMAPIILALSPEDRQALVELLQDNEEGA